jgi:hypothetical protein
VAEARADVASTLRDMWQLENGDDVWHMYYTRQS